VALSGYQSPVEAAKKRSDERKRKHKTRSHGKEAGNEKQEDRTKKTKTENNKTKTEPAQQKESDENVPKTPQLVGCKQTRCTEGSTMQQSCSAQVYQDSTKGPVTSKAVTVP
jgi:hypothetical protein